MSDPVSLAGELVASRYRLVRVLGAGGMGTVYEAKDERIGRIVAAKLLHREVRNDELLARFEREARAAAKLHHPNIVGVHELAHDDTHGPVIVMELLRGISLDERLAGQPVLPTTLALEITLQILDGLVAAHASGVVHRDLKPSNVFLVPLGASSIAVKLLDFGVAKLLEESDERRLTRQGTILGTPLYMSPEQATQHDVDARTDVYAVGACLYEMLGGRPIYDGDSPLAVMRQLVTSSPHELGLLRPDLPLALLDAVRAALARDPNDRWPSAQAMRDALAALLESGRSSLQSAPAPLGPRPADDAGSLDSRASQLTAVIQRPPPAVRRGVPLFVIAAVLTIAIGGAGAGAILAATRAAAPAPPRPSSEPVLSAAILEQLPTAAREPSESAPEIRAGVDPQPPELPPPAAPVAEVETVPAPRPIRARRRTAAPAREARPERSAPRIGTDILSPF